MSGGGLSIYGKHVYCGDYIFSGHTVTLTMGYLIIKQCKIYTNYLFSYRLEAMIAIITVSYPSVQ